MSNGNNLDYSDLEATIDKPLEYSRLIAKKIDRIEQQIKDIEIVGGGVPEATIDAKDQVILEQSKEYTDEKISENLSNYYNKEEVDQAFEELKEIVASETVYVAKNGSDDNVGSELSPFLTISAALASITDASPTKRYVIKVAVGRYDEASVALKANVFILGEDPSATRIGGACSLAPDFSGSADNRSGFSKVTLLSACNFDWNAVTSAAGKLYFQNANFNTTLTLNGYNNGIAQVQLWSTLHFGNFTVSGINLLTVGVRMQTSAFMNQHPILATTWDANGGSVGSLTLTTTVNNFNRRCSMFAKSFFLDNVTVNGPVSYCDYTSSSLGNNNSTLNGGQLIPMNPTASGANTALSNLAFPTAVNQPIMPANTSSTNFGDWGKQWFWSFGYVHASTGTDLFLISYGSSFGADASGKSIGIYTDGAGLQENVNGGNIVLQTASVSGTGVRGKVTLNGREIDVTSKKIVNVANGTDSTDAINKGQLDSAIPKTRSGEASIGDGATELTVTFSSDIGTANYSLNYSLVNLVDANPKFLDKIVTAKTSTGFTVKFHQSTDSANYKLNYTASVLN
jgi:hypothetical protein